MNWSPELLPSGPGTPPAVTEPDRCPWCASPMAVPDLIDTLGCPALWQEMPDGIWVHVWPPRKQRRVTR